MKEVKRLCPSIYLLAVVVVTVSADALQGQLFNHRLHKRQVVFGGPSTGSQSSFCTTPRGYNGFCTELRQCPLLQALLYSTSPSALNYLRKSICGPYQPYNSLVQPKVCCPYSADAGLVENTAPIFGQRPVPPPRPSKLSSLPAQCGYTNATRIRIVGGEEAPLGGWPWATLLGFRDSRTNQIEYLCGGVLITDQHVLTAAHCVNQDLYSVRVGEHDLDSTSDGAQPQDIVIASKTAHENWNTKPIQNDIAILKLSRKVRLTDQVQPVCLPKDPKIANANFVGQKPWVVGWGTTSFNGKTSNVLLEVQIPVVSTTDCKSAYSSFQQLVVDDRTLCAGTKKGGIDSCKVSSTFPLGLRLS